MILASNGLHGRLNGQHSAIIQQLHAEKTSSATIWPQERYGRELLYQVAEELVRPTHDGHRCWRALQR